MPLLNAQLINHLWGYWADAVKLYSQCVTHSRSVIHHYSRNYRCESWLWGWDRPALITLWNWGKSAAERRPCKYLLPAGIKYWFHFHFIKSPTDFNQAEWKMAITKQTPNKYQESLLFLQDWGFIQTVRALCWSHVARWRAWLALLR